ncbi:bifunctional serine/threonine-protein kinase/ABC transporter substrate-binding protein [Yinghuangia soli]|uniref:Bifunctional serine/threonine-protein kinase/ABC transporter substrate-binding protein n=1 Tax=Yinghuangia soli TaxID=2908204 RepID=A0AA41PYF9_9ACTN|nr:bifunctional serine/threonine-protein kinase/ABC transporter substrate-binding protein [Yinghuangia soli]MCF2527481.1 bifunctional serine/threonine-protein kinase/ABC transporter substrate-binding protein [Yinghuangia soli]
MEPLQPEDPRQLADYRLLARLGAGGMGRVYLARSPGGRTVAIKVVRPELALEEGFRTRFRREVAAARRVSGPYTAPVVDADPDAGTPWLATAYVAGPSLVDAVAAHGPLPEATVRALAAGLAEALAAVHAAGLVHRDLKPSNVLLAPDGPRLIDFGVSRSVDDTAITSTGLVVGSPGYMSPEQADGGDIGPASDMFSLASVLVFAATGQGPFGSGSTPSLIYRIVHTQPDLGGVPGYLVPMVAPLLAKDPAQRPVPAQLRNAALPGDQTTEVLTRAGWLPPAITYDIASRSAALLDLEGGTQVPGAVPAAAPPAPAAPPSAVPPPPPPAYAPTVGALPGVPPPGAPVPGGPAPWPPAPVPHEQPLHAGPAGHAGGGFPFGPPGPPPGAPASPAVARRGLLIGGAVVSVAAVGGVAGWLATRSDGGGTGKASGSGSSSTPTGGKPSGSGGASAAPPPSASAKPVYRIGMQGGVTGPNAQLGINVRNGAELAVEQADVRGDLPFRIEFVASDDEASATKAASAAQKLIDNAKVLAVVGPVFSMTAKSALPLYDSAGLATVTPSATNPLLAGLGFDTFHRATPSDTTQGTDMAAYLAKKLMARKVFVLDDMSEYGQGLSATLSAGLGRLGAEVVKDSVPQRTTDFSAAATAVKNSGADAVAYLGYYQEGGLFAKKLAEVGFTGARIGPDGMADPAFVAAAGTAAEGWSMTVPAVDAGAESTLARFAADYSGKYREAPGTYAAEAFDVANLLIQAIKSLGNQPATRAAVLGAVRASRYQGLVKSYAFDRGNGEWAGTGGTFAYEVKSGKIQYLGSVAKLTGG